MDLLKKRFGYWSAEPWGPSQYILILSVMPQRVAGSSCWFGLAVFDGLSSSVLRKQKQKLEWTTMRSGNFRVGFIIWWLACWPISSSGILSSDWGKKAPAITLSQLRILIKVVLPIRHFDCDGLIAYVAWIQDKNHRAYLSHRKKKQLLLNIT